MAEGDRTDRAEIVKVFESEAETLAVHQMDLLAQLEAQIRAVHHTMRSISKLRVARFRTGPELTDAQRADTLQTLSAELTVIDHELTIQHQSCEDMQRTIREMQARLGALRSMTR